MVVVDEFFEREIAGGGYCSVRVDGWMAVAGCRLEGVGQGETSVGECVGLQGRGLQGLRGTKCQGVTTLSV